MSDFTVKTMDEAAFFDGVTWLNQDNWQKFFGKSLPNGILVDGALELGATGYSLQGTLDITQYDSYITIGRGSVMADGLYAELANDVQVMNVTEDQRTKFICVQFNSEQSVAKIIEKVDVANQQGVGLSTAVANLVTDESFFCTRTANIYEIPIAFEYYSSGLKILDLRRLVYAPSGKKRNLNLSIRYSSTGIKVGVLRGNSYAQLYGGTTYYIPITAEDTESYMNIFPMPTNSNESITIFLSNQTDKSKKYILRKACNGTTVSYEWVSNWENIQNGVVNTLSAGASTIIILTPVQIDTGSVKYAVITKSISGEGDFDPDNYYNKNEIDNMLGTKESISDINAKLALKEDIARLKTLAYLDKVNYATQVTNKPADVASDNKYYARRNQAWVTLGAMANAADVGTTGAYYARRNNTWAALGAMATKDKVDYKTDILNTPTIGAIASKDKIQYWDIQVPTGSSSYNTFYVNSTSGNDSNNGSKSNPFKTIQKAVDSIYPFAIGTIYLFPGTYTQGFSVIDKHINFAVVDNLEVTINGQYGDFNSFYGRSRTAIFSRANVSFLGGTWKFYGKSNPYGVPGVIAVDASTVTFKNKLYIYDYTSDVEMLDIFYCSQFNCNSELILQTNHSNSSGIYSGSGSFAAFYKITVNGQFDSVNKFLVADSGIISYGSTNYTDYISKKNGGQIFN